MNTTAFRLFKSSLVLAGLVAGTIRMNASEILWTNTAGGNWSVAANWSPNQLPGASDTAVITNAGTYSVTNNGSRTISGLVLGGPSGTQTLAQVTSYTLYWNTNLNTTNWALLPGVTNRSVENPMVPEKFFRLRRP